MVVVGPTLAPSLITQFLPHKYGKEFLLLSEISQGNFYTGHCTTCIVLNMSAETEQINQEAHYPFSTKTPLSNDVLPPPPEKVIDELSLLSQIRL